MKRYKITLTIIFALLAAACKKNSLINDPDIMEFEVNKTILFVPGSPGLHMKADSIDINSDGKFDYWIQMYNFCCSPACDLVFKNSPASINEVVTGTVVFKTPVTELPAGSYINNGKTFSKTGYITTVNPGVDSTRNVAAGDRYIGLRLYLEGQKHYGWIKVNLSADYRTFRILKGAYHKVSETTIKAGEI